MISLAGFFYVAANPFAAISSSDTALRGRSEA